MKIFIVVLFASILGLMYYFHNKQIDDANKSAPVKYAKSLQNDVHKAEDVAAKAQAAMDRTSQESQKGEQQAQPAPDADPQ